jgi:hypothetical protein
LNHVTDGPGSEEHIISLGGPSSSTKNLGKAIQGEFYVLKLGCGYYLIASLLANTLNPL